MLGIKPEDDVISLGSTRSDDEAPDDDGDVAPAKKVRPMMGLEASFKSQDYQVCTVKRRNSVWVSESLLKGSGHYW